MSLTPREIPTGAVRYNTDSNKMEVYIGDTWLQVAVSSPDLGNSAAGVRGLNMGGQSPGNTATNSIEMITISTAGSAADFGDTTQATYSGGCVGSRTRGVYFHSHAPSTTNVIDFVTFATTGNAQDFGDRTSTEQWFGAFGNQTRGIKSGAWSPGSNILSFVTIATTGDAQDFGDLQNPAQTDGCTASPTRGLIFYGASPGNNYYNWIDYVTIATTGNTQEFGESSFGSAVYGNTAGGNSTRGISYGGAPSAPIEYVTIASTGNTTRFGDFIPTGHNTQIRYGATMCSSTRMVVGGGYTPAAIEDYYYINIATEGTFVEFGDLSVNSQRKFNKGCSNGHGGL